MGSVKMSSSLPPERGKNGLSALADEMASEPEKMHMAVIVFDTREVRINTDNDVVTPTARIKRIEPIERSDDRAQVERIMRRALETRTGETVLDYSLESDLRDAFGAGGDE